MKNSSRTAAATGAAALLAAGLLAAGSATASAAPAPVKAERITSVQQLKASIQQAAARESGGALSENTVGRSAVAPC
ncbi:hypothetical protein AB0912_12455 [Streptomyces sp. NPDC007084]|uniref:hypothetical protein n=1 Tax=Streptomyces sp. NPDC007084 TaxID=3154313 RepID=UPI0034556F26